MASRKQTTTDTAKPRLSDVAYEKILEALFDRKVPAGGFVSQGELCELLDIPVAPLRDALRILETEGILRIHPRSGIEFVRPGIELTRATYQFRLIIERSAVRLFADEGDEALMDDLLARHLDLQSRINEQSLEDKTMKTLDELERSLHNAVVAILGNSLVESTYRRMHNYLHLLRLERRTTIPIVNRTLREHIEILEACRARDPDAAEEALERHFGAALQRYMRIS